MAAGIFDRVKSKAVGELLVEQGLLTEPQRDAALQHAAKQGLRLGEAIVELGLATREMVMCAIAEQFGVKLIELDASMVDAALVSQFPLALLRRHQALPLIDAGDEVVLVVSDPANRVALDELASYAAGRKLTPQLGDASQISRCLDYAEKQLTNARTSAPADFQPLAWLVSLAATNMGWWIVIDETPSGIRAMRQSGTQLVALPVPPVSDLSVVLQAVARSAGRTTPSHGPWMMIRGEGAVGRGDLVIVASELHHLGGRMLRAKALQVVGDMSLDMAPALTDRRPGGVTIVNGDPAYTSARVAQSLAGQGSVLVLLQQAAAIARDAVSFPADSAPPATLLACAGPAFIVCDYVPGDVDLAAILAVAARTSAMVFLAGVGAELDAETSAVVRRQTPDFRQFTISHDGRLTPTEASS